MLFFKSNGVKNVTYEKLDGYQWELNIFSSSYCTLCQKNFEQNTVFLIY